MATYYASGSTWNSAGNWGLTSGAGDGEIPTSNDSVIFDENSISMAIDVNAVCADISTVNTYPGTLTQNSGKTLTIGGYFSWDSGTFAGGDSLIEAGSGIAFGGGTITSTSGTLRCIGQVSIAAGVTWSHNNGTVEMTAAGTITINAKTLYKFIINAGTGTITITGTCLVVNTFTLTASGNINTGTLDLQGDIVLTDATVGGTALVTLTGSAAQQISGAGGGVPDGNWTIDKTNATDTVTLARALSVNASSQTLTLTKGTLVLAGYDLTVNSTFSVAANGTLKLNGTETVSTPTFASGGTCVYAGTNVGTNRTMKNWTYKNLTINDANTNKDRFVFGESHTGIVNLVVTSAGLDLAGFDTTASTSFTVAAAGVLWLNGAESSVTTPTLASGSTVTYYGDNSGTTKTCKNWTYSNITINDAQVSPNTYKFGEAHTSIATFTVTAGTFSQAAGDVAITATGFTVNGGTFTGGTATITINGTFTLNTGTCAFGTQTVNANGSWTYTAGTITPNASRVVFGANLTITGSHTLANVEFVNNVTVAIAGGTILTVSATLYLTGNWSSTVLSGGTIYAKGDIVGTTSTYCILGTTIIEINGTGAQAFTCSSTNTQSVQVNWNINKASGTLTMTGVFAPGSWTYTTGTIDSSAADICFRQNYSTITGSHTLTDVCFIDNVTVNVAGGTILTVSGTLELTGNTSSTTINGGTIYATGNITGPIGANVILGTTSIVINGTGAQLFTASSSHAQAISAPINIDKASGTLTLTGTFHLSYWAYTQGTLSCGTSTFIWDGINGGYITGSHSLSNVTFDGNITTNHTGTLTVTGTLTFAGNNSGTTLNGGVIEAQGDIIGPTGSRVMLGTVTFKATGTANQNLTSSNASGIWMGLEINKASGTVTLGSAINFAQTGQDLTLTSGTLDLAGFNLTINDVLTNSASGIIKLKGTETVTYGTLSNSGTVKYYDSGTTALLNNFGTSFVNITFGASKTHNVTAGTTIAASGVLASDGTSSTRSILRSTTPGTYWNLNLSGSSSLGNKVDVKDSNASSGSTVLAYGSKNSGHNLNWNFMSGNARYCVGATWNTTASWSLTSGGASGASVPGATEDAVFDDWSPSCAIDAIVSVLSLNLTSIYANTLTQNAFAITCSYYSQDAGIFTGGTLGVTIGHTYTGDGTWTLNGGTFTCGSQTITVFGNWTYTAGTFTNTGSTIVLNNTGSYTQTITGSLGFNNVTFSPVNTAIISIATGTTLTVAGTVTFNSSNSVYINGAGTIAAQGDITVNAGGLGGTASLLINGSGAQLFTGNMTETVGTILPVTINCSGTLTLSGTLNITNNWTYTAGTIVSTACTVIFNTNTGNTCTITGSHALANAVLHPYNYTTLAIEASTILTVSNLLTLDFDNSATISGGTVAASKDITVRSTSTTPGNTTLLLINGSGTQNMTATTSGYVPKVQINCSGTLVMSGIFYTDQDWTYTAGTISAGTSTVAFVPRNGQTHTITGSHSLANVRINPLNIGVLVIETSTILAVTGTLTFNSFNSGHLDGGNIYAQGDITIDNDGVQYGTTLLTCTGSATQTLTNNATTGNFRFGLTINKTNATDIVQLAVNCLLDYTGLDVTITKGTLDLAGKNLNVNDVLTLSPGTTLKLKGTETLVYGSKSDYTTWEFYGAGTALLNTYNTTFVFLQIDAGKTVNATAGTTITVNSGIAASGSSWSTPINLHSATPGTTFNLSIPATHSFDHVDFADVVNTGVQLHVQECRRSGKTQKIIFPGVF